MLEIEQKFRDADFHRIEEQLRGWGVHLDAGHQEADHYFNAPDRDFARTGEAFRLRRVGADNCLTYKGPRHAGPVKTRMELEIPVQGGEEGAEKMTRLLGHLGYRPVAVVRKHRRSVTLEREGYTVTLCLDEVEHLGRFAEIEILAEEESKQQAQRVVTDLAGELQLGEVEPRSYLPMVLQALGSA
jgi:adenylate cyclase class 2